MTSMMTRTSAPTVREALLAAIADCALYNSQDVVAPLAILWPDQERLWADAAPALAADRPVLTLGDYDPELERGPVAWIRVRLRELAAETAEDDPVPLVFLPGVSRRNLNDASTLPSELQPIAGIAVRSVVFAQRNGTDWTPSAFFLNKGDGLGLRVSGDRETKEALARHLAVLFDTPVDDLRNRTLTSVDFDQKVVDDPPRQILRWLDNPQAFEAAAKTDGTWKNFVGVVSKDYKVHPEKDGVLRAGECLGEQDRKWAQVWDRFVESPSSYVGVATVLRRARPDGVLLVSHPESWPQENEEQEAQIESSLKRLVGKPVAEIREVVAELEGSHRARRSWVWSRLGQAPFAELVGYLADLADQTREPGYGETVEELAQLYVTRGWRADRAFINCLAALSAGHEARTSVSAVAEGIYRPWLEETSNRFQIAWLAATATPERPAGPNPGEPEGTCVMFIDGLRFDVAEDLAALLVDAGLGSSLDWGLAGVPSVTATCKPAVSPVANRLGGGKNLEPSAPGGAAMNQQHLRKLLEEAGWSLIPSDSTGNPGGRGWTEGGDIDKLGHAVGVNLPQRLHDEARTIALRIQELLAAGWRYVKVVTDHGWLLLPGKLPKQELPEHLTEIRKGRCARLVEGAAPAKEVRVLPWRWDKEVPIAVANSIHAFEAGKVYEHGGLSPQESVVPVLMVTPDQSGRGTSGSTLDIEIDLSWVGLRLKLNAAGAPDGIMADLRQHAGDAASSLARTAKGLKSGRASLMADDTHAGAAAFAVLVDVDGTMLASKSTTIPEG